MKRATIAGLRRAGAAAALVGIALAFPAITAAGAGSDCTVIGTSDSGGTVDLTTTPVWHLSREDHVWVQASAPGVQGDVAVNAYALGYPIPLATGSSEGGSDTASADYEAETLASIGRVFVVSGSSHGATEACETVVQIVIDDVQPIGTALGAGSLAVTLIGALGMALAVRNPSSGGRRVFTLLSLMLTLAAISVAIQQFWTGGPVSTDRAASVFTGSVQAPTDMSLDPVTMGGIAAVSVLVMFLLPFPSELFNRTLDEHHDRIRGWVARIPFLGRLVRQETDEERGGGLLHALGILAFVAISATLYSLLDPNFGTDGGSEALWIGMVVALLAVTWLSALPQRALREAATGDRGRMRAVWVALPVAVACVLISRASGFLPGYLYGLVLGYAFARELPQETEARGISAGAWWMLGLALAAWLMVGTFRAPGVGDTFPGVIGQSVLVAITVAGIEGVVFALLPVRFLHGEPVFRWSKVRWGLLYLIGFFLFTWIILNPANGFVGVTDQASFVTAVYLFIGFGVASVLFWLFFLVLPKRPAA